MLARSENDGETGEYRSCANVFPMVTKVRQAEAMQEFYNDGVIHQRACNMILKDEAQYHFLCNVFICHVLIHFSTFFVHHLHSQGQRQRRVVPLVDS